MGGGLGVRVMNKVFEYSGFKFNIKVELNAVSEKRPNGTTWHEVTVNDMGHANFYFSHKVEDSELERYISSCEHRCMEWVDKSNNISSAEKYLTSVGFK